MTSPARRPCLNFMKIYWVLQDLPADWQRHDNPGVCCWSHTYTCCWRLVSSMCTSAACSKTGLEHVLRRHSQWAIRTLMQRDQNVPILSILKPRISWTLLPNVYIMDRRRRGRQGWCLVVRAEFRLKKQAAPGTIACFYPAFQGDWYLTNGLCRVLWQDVPSTVGRLLRYILSCMDCSVGICA